MNRERSSSAGLIALLCALVAVLFGVVIVKSLDRAKERRIEAQIESLDTDRGNLLQTLASERQHLDELNQQLNNRNAELEEFKTQVQGYMMDHKMVVGAIAAGAGGASIAVDKDNVFTQDAKNSGIFMTVFSAGWILTHPDETIDVVKTLNLDSARVHTMETAIDGLKSSIQQQKLTIEDAQSRLDQLDRRISDLRKQLDK